MSQPHCSNFKAWMVKKLQANLKVQTEYYHQELCSLPHLNNTKSCLLNHLFFSKIVAIILGNFGPRNCTRPGTQYPGTWPLAVPCPGDLSNPGNVSSLDLTHFATCNSNSSPFLDTLQFSGSHVYQD